MKTELKNLILKAAQDLCGGNLPEGFDFELLPPKDPSHGDLACNVAMKISKIVGKNPRETALAIQKQIESSQSAILDKIEIAGPGFMNFRMNKSARGALVQQIIQADQKYGSSDFGKGLKTVVEFVSANPTGPLTIAHGRQAAIGDCLVRILSKAGFDVKAEYYLNDAGRQMRLLGGSVFARYSTELGMPRELPEDGYKGTYIFDLAKDLVKLKGDTLLKLSEEDAAAQCTDYAKDTIMGWIKKDLETTGCHFDDFYSERTLYAENKVEEALNLLKDRGYIFESEGAVWFRSTDLGDDKDRVVKKSTGEYTYLAPDIAYHMTKYNRGFRKIVNLWGPDHHGYIPRLKAACQVLGYDADKIHVGIVQLSTLYRKGEPLKMSTRAGEFITYKELYEEVGIDAARLFFVLRRQESHLDFDLEVAKEKSADNPVYYLQYAHARICSLIEKADRKISASPDVSLLVTQEEGDLIATLSQFPDYVRQSADTLEPYRVVDYLRQLSASFHKFYSQCRVVTDDAALTDARLALCKATQIVLRNGLQLLGISQPTSM